MLRQVHVQVCSTCAEWALGVVTKHKKKCKEVNLSEHKIPCVWDPHLIDALVSVVALTRQLWFCDTPWESTGLQAHS